MANSYKIAILLSTYNGEKYLEKQLDSLINQTYWKYCKLFIRDDGSVDKTHDILKKYSKKENIIVEYGENIGIVKSFFKLINSIDNCDYYFFCDQDDIWKPEKIEKAVTLLCNESCNIPLLYYSDRTVIDKDDKIIVKHDVVSKIPANKFNILTLGHCLAHTICFNNKMNEYMRKLNPQKGEYHDYLMSLIAVYCGKLIYDNSCPVYYRRHSNSFSFITSNKIKLAFSKKFISDLNLSISDFYDNIAIYECKKEDLTLINLFLKKSIKNQLIKAFYFKKYRKQFLNDIYFRFLAVLWRI